MTGKTSPLLSRPLQQNNCWAQKSPWCANPQLCHALEHLGLAPNSRAPMCRGLMGSFKKVGGFYTSKQTSSKTSQAAADPQQAFWNSVALLSTEVPAWPSPPGGRAPHTATAKGDRGTGWKADTSPSCIVIGGGQRSGLAAV